MKSMLERPTLVMPYARQVAEARSTGITMFIFFARIAALPNVSIPKNPFGQLYPKVIRFKPGILPPKAVVLPVEPHLEA
jgi:hypothetical protein